MCVCIYVCAHVASCLIQKHFKLITMKAGRLSETKTSGSPKAAKVVCNFSVVLVAMALGITHTSNHLE